MDNLKNIKTYDSNNIHEILDVIHDKFVDLDSLDFSSNDLKIDLKIEGVKSKDYKIRRRFLIFKRIHYPILLSKLIFKGVTSYKIIDDHEIGIYSINDYSLIENQFTLNFCEITKLRIDFEGDIKIEISDSKRLDEYGPI